MRLRKGDTIVEVTIAIAVFSLVAVISINLMSAGLSTAQASLEVTMAREEINAQAEAIRFVHNSFSLERELPSQKTNNAMGAKTQVYKELWSRLSRDSGAVSSDTVGGGTVDGGMVNKAKNVPDLAVNNCSQVYDGGKQSIFNKDLTAFVINFRSLDPDDKSFDNDDLKEIVVSTANYKDRFVEAVINPRVLFSQESPRISNTSADSDAIYEADTYRYVARAEGIWVIATRDETDNNHGIPEFYDFHIYTCWVAPGKRNPSTIGTIIRLYNPELVEDVR